MSTSITPVSTITAVERDIVWIKGHAIVALLAVALIIGSIIGGVDIFEGLIEKHDARVAAAQLQKEGVDTATQAALLAKFDATEAAATARETAQMALIQNLVQQMSQQHAQTAKQVAKDSNLDLQQAAQRLAQQTKMEDGSVGIKDDLITMSLPLTRIVITDLDLLPQAQSDVLNLQAQLSAQEILTSDAKTEAAAAAQVIAADKTELVATIKADNAACVVATNTAVDKQATKDRKRGLWLTLLGAIAGGFIGHAI